MTPSSSDQVAREAEIMLLRSMSRTMEAMTSEIQAQRKDMTDVKMDIAVIKERQMQNGELRDSVSSIKKDIEALKSRNDQQDGAMSGLKFAKEFGPWLVSLVLLAWGLFGHGIK